MSLQESVLERTYGDILDEQRYRVSIAENMATMQAIARATLVDLSSPDAKEPDMRIAPEDPKAARKLANMAVDLWGQHGFSPISILSGSEPVQVEARDLVPGILGFAHRPLPVSSAAEA